MTHPLCDEIRKALREAADPVKAAQMRKYMKSEMPFRGVQSPRVKTICRRIFPEHPLPGAREWREVILELFVHGEFREERYVALAVAGVKAYRPYQTMTALELYEEVVVTGAWWDFVDDVSKRLGEMLIDYPEPMAASMRKWGKDQNFWKRRASIICQLSLKKDTDVPLLIENMEASMDEVEFFLRKGIGWALREYAKTDPDMVISFVRKHKKRLSPLSKREGLRILLKNGVIDQIP